jgi:cell division protein FtsB
MLQKRYKPEEIINKLRSAEGKQYGGMKVEQARRFKKMEAENARLKKQVADLSLDKEILKEAVSKNF